MSRPHQIEPGQWIDLDAIARLWVIDYDPAYQLGRFGDRRDAVARIEEIAALWTASPEHK